MGLESLVKPLKWVDEQILTQYTKITKKWEDKGRSKYSLAMICNAPTWVTGYIGTELAYGFFIVPFLRGHDFAGNLIGLHSGEQSDGVRKDGDNFIIYNRYLYVWSKIAKTLRSPMFLAGTSLIAKTGYDFYNYWKNKEPTDPECFKHFMLGISFLGLSSSIYIKDSDPKLLEKEPFIKKAYNWLKEKTSSIIKRPVPQPAPAVNYSLH